MIYFWYFTQIFPKLKNFVLQFCATDVESQRICYDDLLKKHLVVDRWTKNTRGMCVLWTANHKCTDKLLRNRFSWSHGETTRCYREPETVRVKQQRAFNSEVKHCWSYLNSSLNSRCSSCYTGCTGSCSGTGSESCSFRHTCHYKTELPLGAEERFT